MSQNLPPGFGDWAKGSKYDLFGTLGVGTMGVVLDGRDRVIKRPVAIKVVRKPSTDDIEAMEVLARFRLEPVTAGGLSHPGIVAIYDYGEDSQFAWMVMEKVTGGTLDSLLRTGGRWPLPRVAEFMVQVLKALSYAHARGVVHRDIKPANIMLTEDGQPKLVDFGVARGENADLTVQGAMMGTPSTMAPEQFRGEPAHAQADIWAAGVILYQLLTGQRPFAGEMPALLHKVLHTEPPLPSEVSETIPRAMDAVVMRALAKRPADRWPDARTFADAVALAATEPVVPPGAADGATDRLTAFNGSVQAGRPPSEAPPGRRPGWLLAGGGLAVLAVGSLIASLFWPAPLPPLPPRPDLRAAVAAALAAAPCGLLSSRVEEATFQVEGVLPREEAARLRAELAGRDLPPGAARLNLGAFDGPFCAMFAALRPALAQPGEGPEVSILGGVPLRQDDLLRLDVTVPPWANHLHVAYATLDGNLVRLEPGVPGEPGASVRLGEPRPGFTGWLIDRPFGTDLILVVASDGLLFQPGTPEEQSQAEYAASFAQAFRAMQQAGRRVALRPAVVETAARE